MRTLAIILMILFASCRKDRDDVLLLPSKLITPANLIQNSSFELSGNPSFQHWQFPYGICCPDTFSTDVPVGGGFFSLNLQPQWYPSEGAAETYITGLSASNSFLLKFYARCINAPASTAYASVYLKGLTIASFPAITFSASQWTQYQLTTGVFTITPSDTIAVRLSAGATEVASWQVLFDRIELYKLP